MNNFNVWHLDYIVTYTIFFLFLWAGMLNKGVLVSMFQHRLVSSYFVLIWLSFLVVVSVMTGSVPLNFILGVKGFLVFNLSWSIWFSSFFASSLLKLRFFIGFSLFVVFLFLFDSFVVLLRPVTLSLRVFINVSLGHFLMVMVHLNLLYLLYLVFLLEIFVYVVQTYVYLTLSKSYLEALN